MHNQKVVPCLGWWLRNKSLPEVVICLLGILMKILYLLLRGPQIHSTASRTLGSKQSLGLVDDISTFRNVSLSCQGRKFASTVLALHAIILCRRYLLRKQVYLGFITTCHLNLLDLTRNFDCLLKRVRLSSPVCFF